MIHRSGFDRDRANSGIESFKASLSNNSNVVRIGLGRIANNRYSETAQDIWSQINAIAVTL